MATLRLFLALWPTPATRAAAGAAQQVLPWPAAARRVSASDLHLTLAFIGAVPQEQLAHVTRAAAVTSARIALSLDRIEVWKAGTVVLRPSCAPAAMLDLHARLTQSLRACDVAFDARPFVPHVTLGRKARGMVAAAVPPLPWRSAGHVLALSAGGRYSVIARFG